MQMISQQSQTTTKIRETLSKTAGETFEEELNKNAYMWTSKQYETITYWWAPRNKTRKRARTLMCSAIISDGRTKEIAKRIFQAETAFNNKKKELFKEH